MTDSGDRSGGVTPDDTLDTDEFLGRDIFQGMSSLVLPDVLDSMSDLVCVCVNGRIRHVNKTGLSILGAQDVSEVLGISFLDLLQDGDANNVDDLIALFTETCAKRTPLRIRELNGAQIRLHLKAIRIPGLGDTAHLLMGQNVTQQEELAEAVQQSDERFSKLVNGALDLICVMSDGYITYINDAGLKLLKATSQEEVVGKPLCDFMHADYKGILTGDIRELIDDHALLPLRFIDMHNTPIDVEVGIAVLDDQDGLDFMIEARDITAHNVAVSALRHAVETLEQRVEERTRELQDEIAERRRAEENLRHVASHDNLTGLPNRLLLMDRLHQTVERARRHGNKCAVLFIDLDGFKPINDTLGHDAGDMLLKKAASRLERSVRTCDTAARFGGDEFILVLDDLDDAEASTLVAEKVLKRLAEPVDLQGHEVFIGASIGIAVYPNHGLTAEELLKQADIAMYDVKGSGKNAYALVEDKQTQLPGFDAGRVALENSANTKLQ